MVIVPELFAIRIALGYPSFARLTAIGNKTKPEHAVSTNSVHSTNDSSSLEEDATLVRSRTLIKAYLPADGRMYTSAPFRAATAGLDGPKS